MFFITILIENTERIESLFYIYQYFTALNFKKDFKKFAKNLENCYNNIIRICKGGNQQQTTSRTMWFLIAS